MSMFQLPSSNQLGVAMIFLDRLLLNHQLPSFLYTSPATLGLLNVFHKLPCILSARVEDSLVDNKPAGCLLYISSPGSPHPAGACSILVPQGLLTQLGACSIQPVYHTGGPVVIRLQGVGLVLHYRCVVYYRNMLW